MRIINTDNLWHFTIIIVLAIKSVIGLIKQEDCSHCARQEVWKRSISSREHNEIITFDCRCHGMCADACFRGFPTHNLDETENKFQVHGPSVSVNPLFADGVCNRFRRCGWDHWWNMTAGLAGLYGCWAAWGRFGGSCRWSNTKETNCPFLL